MKSIAAILRAIGLGRLADKLDPVTTNGSGGPGPFVPPKD